MPSTTLKITDSAIRAAITTLHATGAKEDLLRDSELTGFLVRIGPSGAVFSVYYRVGGGRSAQQRKYKIGPFGAFNATQARALAKEVLHRAALGDDPADKREERRNDFPVAELFDAFVEHHAVAKCRPNTIRDYRRLGERIIKPALGRLSIKALETADIARLHQRLRKTPVQANRTLAILSKFASWCEQNGYRAKFTNPAKGIEKYREKGRTRYLSAAEIERLGAVLAASDDYPPAIAALKLLVFTGARHTEITTLKWSQVDMQRGIARLTDAKTGDRNLMLPAPALQVLAELPRRVDNPYVIWGRAPGSHFVRLQQIWDRVRVAADIPDVRIHDLRHTHAAIAVAGGASLRLVGAVLGHASVLTTGRYAHVADDPAAALAAKTASQIDALMRKGAAR